MVVYQLKADTNHIARVKRATRTTKVFGIESTHGLFGSEEWWKQIASGRLRVITLKGVIAKCYMGSMNDWPMFDLLGDDGEKTRWTRQLNAPELDSLYREGSTAEIDYVMQNHRPRYFWRRGVPHKVVIEIRITAVDK